MPSEAWARNVRGYLRHKREDQTIITWLLNMQVLKGTRNLVKRWRQKFMKFTGDYAVSKTPKEFCMHQKKPMRGCEE